MNRTDIPTGAWNLLCGPWALSASYANAVVPALNSLDWARHMTAYREDPTEGVPPTAYEVTDGITVLDLSGPMTRGETSMSAMFGGTSTVALRRAVRQAAKDPNVTGILLRVDSPGGEVDGTADLSADVKAVAANKPLLVYVAGAADSAAYWTAAQASEIWAGSTARVGCIGTYLTITDSSEAARADGVRVHVVKAGAYKGTGIPGAEVSPAALARVQETVNGINDEFLAAVAAGRGLTAEQVAIAADGEEFHARRALEMGLIDRIGSEDEAMEHLRAMAKGRKPMDAVDSFRALLGLGPRGATDVAAPEAAIPTATLQAGIIAPSGTAAIGATNEHPLIAACKANGITDAAALSALVANAALGEQYTARMRDEAEREYIRAVGGAEKADAARIEALKAASFEDARNARDIYADAADAKFGKTAKIVAPVMGEPVKPGSLDAWGANGETTAFEGSAAIYERRKAEANGKGAN